MVDEAVTRIFDESMSRSMFDERDPLTSRRCGVAANHVGRNTYGTLNDSYAATRVFLSRRRIFFQIDGNGAFWTRITWAPNEIGR